MTQTEKTAIRMLQGYIWHEKKEDISLSTYLLSEWNGIHILWDAIHPPFAFFENGTPTESQMFYQFTAFALYTEKPSDVSLHERAEQFSQELGQWLHSTPSSVGWQLWEDLRPIE